MPLTRDQILEANDIQIEKVATPEWGGDGITLVRSLDGRSRDAFEAGSMVKNARSGSYDMRLENLRARLLVLAICDEDGKRIFTDADVGKIGAKNAGVLARVYDVATRLSGISRQDVDELVKNSDGDPSADSTSG